jgi:hypothetical protein
MAMLSALWNNPAGGLRYHFRALRYRERAWAPFREQLATWLSSWTPPARSLAIVGPSAGHCLPLSALQHFERFLIFEPDPLACLILKRRMSAQLPGRSIEWFERDFWIAPLLAGGAAPSALLGPDTALLFSNVVGQLSYLVRDAEYPRLREAWRRQVWPLLSRLHWASFHDRVSSSIAPPSPLPISETRLNDAELRALYERSESNSLVELVDHDTSALLPEARGYSYFHWPLTPTWHHLIEAVQVAPST